MNHPFRVTSPSRCWLKYCLLTQRFSGLPCVARYCLRNSLCRVDCEPYIYMQNRETQAKKLQISTNCTLSFRREKFKVWSRVMIVVEKSLSKSLIMINFNALKYQNILLIFTINVHKVKFMAWLRIIYKKGL